MCNIESIQSLIVIIIILVYFTHILNYYTTPV